MLQLIQYNFDTLREEWTNIFYMSSPRVLFSSPAWAELWWRNFAGADDLYLNSVVDDSTTIGIAPLRIREGIAYLIGSDDVCDFLDFLVRPGCEEIFFNTLLEQIAQSGIKALHLSPLIPESTVVIYLKPIAASKGLEMICEQEDVTVYLDLPSELNQYHALLSGKQRHELLRKERRLNEEGDLKFINYSAPGKEHRDTFLNFFRESRDDKKEFLTAGRQNFFQSIFEDFDLKHILKLGILELKSRPIAATLCFDYRNEVYLYNSGYDPSFRSLSAGLLSKYYCIKDSIERGTARFDFLKGAE